MFMGNQKKVTEWSDKKITMYNLFKDLFVSFIVVNWQVLMQWIPSIWCFKQFAFSPQWKTRWVRFAAYDISIVQQFSKFKSWMAITLKSAGIYSGKFSIIDKITCTWFLHLVLHWASNKESLRQFIKPVYYVKNHRLVCEILLLTNQ